VQRLKEIGDYLKKCGESIYCTSGGIYDDKLGGTTATDKAIYVHVLKVPSNSTLKLPPISRKIASATYLRDNRKAAFRQSEEGIS